MGVNKASLMKVHVATVSGNQVEVIVDSADRVQGLQHQVRDLIPSVSSFKLVYNGRILKSSLSLAGAGVEDGASITIVATRPFALTASRDGTARLWSVETGDCTQTFAGHESLV